ncbi:unnamed protein product [Pleuronectes platessa]|uniref:Uncharacterized protein n=1 Tax=Pleuronectes platessa TaxID=8262 RepID=A0A9N7VL30_PLEPL|nr:unnamed protein product [Pleuronectes platessa]
MFPSEKQPETTVRFRARPGLRNNHLFTATIYELKMSNMAARGSAPSGEGSLFCWSAPLHAKTSSCRQVDFFFSDVATEHPCSQGGVSPCPTGVPLVSHWCPTIPEHDQSVRGHRGRSRKLFSAGFRGAQLLIQLLATELMNRTTAGFLM